MNAHREPEVGSLLFYLTLSRLCYPPGGVKLHPSERRYKPYAVMGLVPV